MPASRRQQIAQISCYYLIWIMCVLSSAQNQAWLGMSLSTILLTGQIFWQIKIAHDSRHLWAFIFQLTLCGLIVDSSLAWFDMIVYQDNFFAPYLCPPWLLILWAELALILHALMRFLWARPWYTAAFSAVGFPLAYLAAATLGAAELTHGVWSAAVVGIVWMILLPILLLHHNQRVNQL